MGVAANRILMVRPAAFGYDPLTAESNTFQSRAALESDEINRRARAEFDSVAEGLRGLGIGVLVLDEPGDSLYPNAVFPNNWFSTHTDGTLCLYPMEAVSRRGERRPEFISRIESAFMPRRVLDLSSYENKGKYLEGTGSLVIDHSNKRVYACLSSRTDESLLRHWSEQMDHDVVAFSAMDVEGVPVYHTNVMMSVGDKLAVVCLESIRDAGERSIVAESLAASGREMIEISLGQMGEFAGNVIELATKDGARVLVMSESARRSFQPTQLDLILSHCQIASFAIPLIEKCGGGSIRCMVAEIFEQR